MRISRLLNRAGHGSRRRDVAEQPSRVRVGSASDVNEPGRSPMTFVGKLSMVTAYIALAFVGAIVLGVI